MPQLEKGGKWVFGWVVVRPGVKITIPPEAYREYGFQAGEEIVFTRGSGYALGFLAQGPICEKALRHSELITFP